jgi:hypothetical protein
VAKKSERFKRRFIASPDQVRIIRQGDTAIIEYAEDRVMTTHLKLGPELAQLTDEDIVRRHKLSCTLPAFAARWAFCKHSTPSSIEHRLSMIEAPPPKGTSYNDGDWSQYNAGHVNEGDNFAQLLHGLC